MFTSPIYESTSSQPIGPLTLTNVSNGVIERNYFVDSQLAVAGYSLSNCSISDNILSVTFAGMHVSFSNSTIISNNTQGYKAISYGLAVHYCNNCTVTLNEFKNITGMGMAAIGNFDFNVTENSFTGFADADWLTWDGIYVSAGEECIIQKNTLANFRMSGIEIRGRNSIVQNNNITSCVTGILVSTNDSSTITENRISDSFRAIEMVQANNTKVHGNFIIGDGRYDSGISTVHGHDCDIYSNEISQVGYGIVLQGSIRFNVSSNSVTDGRYGFAFGWYSNWGWPNGPFSDCDIANNTFDKGGVYLPPENYEGYDLDTIRFEGNTVHGDPIGIFANLNHETIDGNSFGQLLLVNCTGITISGGNFHDINSDTSHDEFLDTGAASAITLLNCTACDLANINFHNNSFGVTFRDTSHCSMIEGLAYNNSWTGISISNSANINIDYFDIRYSQRGIDLSNSYNCEISDCDISNNEIGIFLRNGFNSTLSHNTIFQNTDGCSLGNSDGTVIRDSDIFSNQRGILLNSTSECLITENNIHNNTGVGISLDRCS
jgi:parallel beta-helix repeat protein